LATSVRAASELRRSRGGRSAVRTQRQIPGEIGETIVGRDWVRDMLALMIRSKTKLQRRAIKAISADDVAVLYTDFQGTTMDALEKTIDVRYNAIEVLRREPDGYWKLIVGDPNRRE
jgi:ketosteroid isomerase-like protein